MRGILVNLVGVHGGGAVVASMPCIRTGYADVEGGETVAQGTCQNICWSQTSPRYKPWRLQLRERIALRRDAENLFGHCIVPPGRLSGAAAECVRASRVKQVFAA